MDAKSGENPELHPHRYKAFYEETSPLLSSRFGSWSRLTWAGGLTVKAMSQHETESDTEPGLTDIGVQLE